MGPIRSCARSDVKQAPPPRVDPRAPLRGPRAVWEMYAAAGPRVQNSYEYYSLSTAKVVRAHVEEEGGGRGLEKGTVCEPDEIPFVGRVDDVRAMDAEDEKLLGALRSKLSEVLPVFRVGAQCMCRNGSSVRTEGRHTKTAEGG